MHSVTRAMQTTQILCHGQNEIQPTSYTARTTHLLTTVPGSSTTQHAADPLLSVNGAVWQEDDP
jgi:hypothetical protein